MSPLFIIPNCSIPYYGNFFILESVTGNVYSRDSPHIRQDWVVLKLAINSVMQNEVCCMASTREKKYSQRTTAHVVQYHDEQANDVKYKTSSKTLAKSSTIAKSANQKDLSVGHINKTDLPNKKPKLVFLAVGGSVAGTRCIVSKLITSKNNRFSGAYAAIRQSILKENSICDSVVLLNKL